LPSKIKRPFAICFSPLNKFKETVSKRQ